MNYTFEFLGGDCAMELCIYYKKSEGLRFTKQEHIIPAGLGGKQMLGKGVVSDQANERFSKTELKVLRDSFIGLNRMNNGPGKRGSLKLKKVKNPTVTVIKSDSANHKIDTLLGFIFLGKSVVIPQLNTYWDDPPFYRYVISNIDTSSVDFLKTKLNDNVIDFLESKERNYKSVHMPFTTDKKFVHIGLYEKTWYVTTSFKEQLVLDHFAHDILPTLYDLREKLKCAKYSFDLDYREDMVFKFKKELETNFSNFGFLYLKTAFNALAFVKGSEYVMNNIFDELRETILYVREPGKFIRLKKDLEHPEIESYIKKFPNKAHYVILFSKGKKINAYVSFYGEPPAVIELTNNYEEDNFMDGLICDWENREETRLEKWRS